MTSPEAPDTPVTVDPAVAAMAMRVAVARKALDDASREYDSVKAAAAVPFADIRRRGIPSHEVRLPDGTKVALITIEKGAEVLTVSEDELLGVIAVNEPDAFETFIDPAALADPKVIAFLAAHFPDHARTRVRADVDARYRREAAENGGKVWLRAGRSAGEQVQVAVIENLPATGKYSVLWEGGKGGKGMVQLGEAIDAGVISQWGEILAPGSEPEGRAMPAAVGDAEWIAWREAAARVLGKEPELPQPEPAVAAEAPPPAAPAEAEPDHARQALDRAMTRGAARRTAGPGLAPTREQQAIIDAWTGTGDNLTIRAGAGAGKTTQLIMLGEATDSSGLYLSFNKALATEAKRKLPPNVACSTAHALAFAATGREFSHRLNGPRIPAREVAKILGVNDPLRAGERMLAPEQVARLAMETAERFMRSADAEPGPQHVPAKPGLDGKDAMAVLRQALTPLARQAWADLSRTDGKLRYSHDCYLKSWQLSGPAIDSDYVFFDECQPTGTQVMVVDQAPRNLKAGDRTTVRHVPIESLKVGDLVVSYDREGPRLKIGGSRLSDVRSRSYAGELITVTTDDGQTSRYTPDHKCIALVGDALADKWALYLMRRGSHFRIGITRGFYGRGNSAKTYRGVRARAWEENADAAWVLDVFDDEADARVAEAFNSWKFRLPQMRFNGANPAQTAKQSAFWNKIDDLSGEATACLKEFGRRIEYPFWSGATYSYAVTRRPSVVRACNLLDGMQLIAADEMVARPQNVHKRDDLTTISVRRDYYAGDIWSLEVERDHTYVADGLVTHNCQDADAVVTAVLLAQRNLRLVTVGDPNQELYAWRGAVSAMDAFGGREFTLSQSFRFGPAVAGEANKWLELLESDLRIRGTDAIPSALRVAEWPDAVLCRTNGGALAEAMRALDAGMAVAIAGGSKPIRALAEAAACLKNGRRTSHPELFAFASWAEVQDHVENDPSGSDLAVMVRLIDSHGPEEIIAVCDRLADERSAEVLVSTGHKAKGLEWDSVRIGTDFRPPKRRDDGTDAEVPKPDARLAYVAVTRAKLTLDREGLAWVDRYLPGGAS